MKILVLGNSEWDDTNAVGNTLSNWFSDWEDTELFFMYSRDALPKNNCCGSYYTVSLLNIIKNIFTPWRIGKEFDKYCNLSVADKSTEQNAINTITGFKREVAKLVADILYSSNIWLNKKTRNYIKKVNPDIVFLFAISDSYRFNLLRYIKENTNAKIVEFIADDMYGSYCDKSDILSKLCKKRYSKMLKMSDTLYGASEMLCENYKHIFNINIRPLYKGCYIKKPKSYVNKPITMIYAGNLFYGRDYILLELSKQISLINRDGIKMKLEIYTNSYVQPKAKQTFNDLIGISINGAIPYSQIVEKQHESDLVLHVESFEEKEKKYVRYSFSTKICDCLQSGSAFMVIGPKGISSIEYTRNINGAIVIDEIESIKTILSEIVHNPQQLIHRANMINDFAITNHEISNVRDELKHQFELLIQ